MQRPRRPRSRAPALMLVAGLALACASPVGVKREEPTQVHRELTANVLTAGRPSDRTLQVLERFGLRERFDEDPAAVLALLHAGLQPTGDHRRLSALAELSFYHGERASDPRYLLASAIYAYALLFPGPGGETLDASDPRVRLAYDLYNRGLTAAVGSRLGSGKRVLELPFGRLELAFDPSELDWAGHRLEGFVDAANYSVRGLRDRFRRPGLGAAFAASLGAPNGQTPPSARFLTPGLRVPTTVVLRLESPRAALIDGNLRGRLEILTPDEAAVVEIDGHPVPIEFETTFALAETLKKSRFFEFELKGFFSGAFRPLRSAVIGTRQIAAQDPDEGLFFLEPYRSGHIPVVLVHGTASSPARWGDLVNELSNDRVIGDRFQFWLFLYNTGNPVAYSGGQLRAALERAVATLDPAGNDRDLERMVVIGHSQGGLLTKTTAIDSGSRFWDDVSKVPLAQLELSPETRATFERSFFFTPEPFVKRVIFVCTPHHGSYLASLNIARLVSDFVGLPSNLVQAGAELVHRNPGKLLFASQGRLPTSIENMTPGNRFLRRLAETPIAPGIAAHSIIAVRGEGPPQGQSDGVVAYSSAHVEGVESELVVHSGHSAQGNPDVILEVRRILLEHAAAG